jgi:hypothetical protein
MTRKHFERIAQILKDHRYAIAEAASAPTHYDNLVSELADLCGEMNERFDRDRFFKAVYKK